MIKSGECSVTSTGGSAIPKCFKKALTFIRVNVKREELSMRDDHLLKGCSQCRCTSPPYEFFFVQYCYIFTESKLAIDAVDKWYNLLRIGWQRSEVEVCLFASAKQYGLVESIRQVSAYCCSGDIVDQTVKKNRPNEDLRNIKRGCRRGVEYTHVLREQIKLHTTRKGRSITSNSVFLDA